MIVISMLIFLGPFMSYLRNALNDKISHIKQELEIYVKFTPSLPILFKTFVLNIGGNGDSLLGHFLALGFCRMLCHFNFNYHFWIFSTLFLSIFQCISYFYGLLGFWI